MVASDTVPAAAADTLEAATRPCSKKAVNNVLNAGQTEAMQVIIGMMANETLCAVCLIQALTQPMPDGISLAFACHHQNENRCDEDTGLSRILPSLRKATLSNRETVLALMVAVEAGATGPADSSAWSLLTSVAWLRQRKRLDPFMFSGADCAYCVLETVEYVCGEGCAKSKLHVRAPDTANSPPRGVARAPCATAMHVPAVVHYSLCYD
jgi:hypothetical protein